MAAQVSLIGQQRLSVGQSLPPVIPHLQHAGDYMVVAHREDQLRLGLLLRAPVPGGIHVLLAGVRPGDEDKGGILDDVRRTEGAVPFTFLFCLLFHSWPEPGRSLDKT